MSRCLTLLGTGSIQGYIFRSNRLKENIGASWLVANALNHWDREPACSGLEEVIFVGGGNAALIFSNRQVAIKAVADWSRRLLESAPALRLTVVHHEYAQDNLREEYGVAQRKLVVFENELPFGSELGGLPVVRACSSTGMAASEFLDGDWLSSESAAKRRAAQIANTHLAERYAECLGVEYAFPSRVEALGIETGASQIAIVHADGNGIGNLLRLAAKSATNDDELVKQLRKTSRRITMLASSAFRSVLRDLRIALPDLVAQNRVSLRDAEDEHGRKCFPVRPLVDGGDDLTFVCHGRLGLALACRYLDHFEKQSGNELSACAGVLIMPQKYPFARGYELAEQLTQSAKHARREAGAEGSWLDFQVLIEGSSGSLEALRRYAYYRADGREKLVRRPYRWGSVASNGWQSFESIWHEFHDWPRSLAKRLLEDFARGENATARTVEEFQSRKRSLPGGHRPFETVMVRGKRLQVTRYFDPLEALDYHVSWPKPKVQVDDGLGEKAQK